MGARGCRHTPRPQRTGGADAADPNRVQLARNKKSGQTLWFARGNSATRHDREDVQTCTRERGRLAFRLWDHPRWSSLRVKRSPRAGGLSAHCRSPRSPKGGADPSAPNVPSACGTAARGPPRASKSALASRLPSLHASPSSPSIAPAPPDRMDAPAAPATAQLRL